MKKEKMKFMKYHICERKERLKSERKREKRDEGSQCRCGRVGRNVQLPSTPHSPTALHSHNYLIR